MDVNWDEIKRVWKEGVDSLSEVAHRYKVSIPEISLKANQEGWGERGSVSVEDPDVFEPPDLDIKAEILTDKQVLLAHKTDIGRLRLIAAAIMEGIQYETSSDKALKKLERLMKIYAQLVPLERKNFEMDSVSDDAPDGIVINFKK